MPNLTLCPCCGKDRRHWTGCHISFPGAVGSMICSSCYTNKTPESDWTPAYAAYVKRGYRDSIGPQFERLIESIKKAFA